MDFSTFLLSKSYTDKKIREAIDLGFKVEVKSNRDILQTTGEDKILYLLPKTNTDTKDEYDEYVYVNNDWEWIGHTVIDLSNYYTKTEIDNKGYLTQHQDISGKEDTSNKVVSISAQSTDNQYPTAKCVYDAIESAIASQATDLSSATVTLSTSSFTYDGTSKVPSVTSVILDGQTLTSGTDYAVVSSPATNAGAYTLTVNGIGSYSGTVTANWTINKAQATISGADSISVVGIGESESETYTTTGDGALSFSISDSSVATISNSGGQVTVTSVAAGSTTLTVTVADGTNYTGTSKTVTVAVTEASANTVFGVVWDYSLNSPVLTRLTPQTDPLGVVTTVPLQEPTACVGNDGNGQSDFDNYMPWAGIQRYNYVNGQVVDFVDYSNGETFVYIPEFWSKIVDDSKHSRMYFYISSEELTGFTKHLGSDRYVGRYECDSNFLSVTGNAPKGNTTFADFRTGITSIDSNHFQYDLHCYNAIILLYIVEFANLNSQDMIGLGITVDTQAHVSGGTDTLTYHTGRQSGTDNQCSVQYRWIENLWGNLWNWIDGVLLYDGKVYICNEPTKYSDSITNDYIDTNIIISVPASNAYIKAENCYNNQYLIPKNDGGSTSTFLCDKMHFAFGLRGTLVGGSFNNHNANAGLFCWNGDVALTANNNYLGSRSILILGGES